MSARDLLDEALTKLDERVKAHSVVCVCGHGPSHHQRRFGVCDRYGACGCRYYEPVGEREQ